MGLEVLFHAPGGRDNSGVILSLLFRGISKGLEGKEEASAQDLIHAMEIGVEAAYQAVMKPTEGTMLTVARVVWYMDEQGDLWEYPP